MAMSRQTMMAPIGGELYQEVADRQGKRILLTYNDLWTIIVCRASFNSNWVQIRQAAKSVTDPTGKQAVIARLWELEKMLGALPEIPLDVQTLHGQRAQHWFKTRSVVKERQW